MTNAKFSPVDLNATAGFYEEYYSQQHGNGLSAFAGRKHMDGDGLARYLGDAFKSVVPSIKRLGRSALRTMGKSALNVAKDVLSGEDIGVSALRNLKNTGKHFVGDVAQELTSTRKRKRTSAPKRTNKRQRGGTIFG